MWECEWSLLKREDENVRSFVDSLKLVTRLLPRDAFFGGRTNGVKVHQVKVHHVAAKNEKIHYVDFTLFYPWVNKNCLYPVGHFLRAGGYRHFVVLWLSKMHRPSTLCPVPSRTTLQTRWETYLFVMSEVCGRRATQTADQAFAHLHTHRQGAFSSLSFPFLNTTGKFDAVTCKSSR